MTTEQLERRAAELEVRAKGRKLEGYAAVFDTRVKIADFDELISRGAFADSLKSGNDVLGLIDHDPSRLLSRTRNGSLRLAEDTRGLHFEIDLPRTTLADDVLALAEAGTLGGASFGFNVKRDAWVGTLRTLHAVDLREISIVSAWPAYPQTSVSARSAAALRRRVAVNETVTAAQAMEMLGLASRTTFRALARHRGWQSEYRRGFPSLWRRDDIEAEIAARSSRTVHRSQRPPGSGTVAAKAAARERACLRCKQPFPSWGAGNRLCEPCRDYARSVRSSVDD